MGHSGYSHQPGNLQFVDDLARFRSPSFGLGSLQPKMGSTGLTTVLCTHCGGARYVPLEECEGLPWNTKAGPKEKQPCLPRP